MAKHAIVIGIEAYHNKIAPVTFAENDARGIKSALEAQKFDVEMLLNAEATHVAIHSRLRLLVKRLEPGDTLFVYYAGHGFSKNGLNYLSAFDTDPRDLEGTCVKLDDVFAMIDGAKADRTALFLDACFSGIKDIAKTRGLIGALSEGDLNHFLKAAEYRICFSSCKPDEYSWPSSDLKHGIWTYHLLQALNGMVPEILENGRHLTANGLQDYLAAAVRETVRRVRTAGHTQHPQVYGSKSHDFEIADLGEILRARQATVPLLNKIKSFTFQKVNRVSISDLSGFSRKRGHRVPDYFSPGTQGFIESCATEEIDGQMETVFAKAKATFGYKQRHIHAEEGRVIAPHFEYTTFATQASDEPGECELIERLDLAGVETYDPDGLQKVFGARFNQAVFTFERPHKMTSVIDYFEELDADVDYGPEKDSCTVTFDDSDLELHVTAQQLTVISSEALSVPTFIELLKSSEKTLAGQAIAKLIAPRPKKAEQKALPK